MSDISKIDKNFTIPEAIDKEDVVFSSLTPKSSTTVLVFKGSVAADEEVEKPNKATFEIFFTNIIGFNPVVK